jgi:hypothetical protein
LKPNSYTNANIVGNREGKHPNRKIPDLPPSPPQRRETELGGDLGGGYCRGKTPLIAPPSLGATSWNKALDKEGYLL